MHETSVATPRPRGSERGAAFASLIISARRERGWTHDELTTRSGVSRSTLFRWEAGNATAPNPDQLRRVCHALGVDHRHALVALGYLTDADLVQAA